MPSKSVRAVAALSAMAIVAAGCSKPKTFNAKKTKTTEPEVAAPVGGDTTTTTTPAAAAAAAAQQAAAAATAKRTVGASTPGGQPLDTSQLKAVGAKIFPQSTQRRKPYYAGVGENTIQLDFSIDATNCGVNVVNALTAAGGALPTQSRFYRAAPTTNDQVTAERREAIDIMIKYWNAHAFDFYSADFYPNLRPLMGNDPNNQFYGRHLVANVIDGGSNQCPDKTTAASKQASEQDHAFSVYTDYDGSQANMAAALNTVPADRRPMHFGTLWLPDSYYAKYAPYVWTQFSTGSTITREWASYICKRVRTGDVPARAPGVNPKNRRFGLVHTNLPQDRDLANEFKGYISQYCGTDAGNVIAKEVEYDGTDFGNAQQQDPNVIAQLQIAGVTSVIMLTEPIQPLFQMTDAQQAQYYPEWIFSSIGYSDSNTVQRLYQSVATKEAPNDFGTSNLGVPGGWGFSAGDPFWMYHTLHPKGDDGAVCDTSSDAGMNHPGCKAPTALVTWYYTLLPSIGGIVFAGPDLTPQNVTNGLQAYPSTRYGSTGPTADPRPALVGAGKNKYGFIVDSVEWRFRPDYQSPPPENKAGWVEYPDCQRHYLTWGDQLAPNWEVNGPNYSAWCGVKKDPYGNPSDDYPRVLPEDSTH